MDIENKVEEMKTALKDGAWNDISSKVWGDKDYQRALSTAARAGDPALPSVEFKKDEDGSLILEFSRPGVTGWVKDHLSGKPAIKF